MKSFLWWFWQRRKKMILFTLGAVSVFLFGCYIFWQWFIGAWPPYPNSAVYTSCLTPEPELNVYGDSISWHWIFYSCFSTDDATGKVKEWFKSTYGEWDRKTFDKSGSSIIADIKLGSNQLKIKRMIYGGDKDFSIIATYELYLAFCPAKTWMWFGYPYKWSISDGVKFLVTYCSSDFVK